MRPKTSINRRAFAAGLAIALVSACSSGSSTDVVTGAEPAGGSHTEAGRADGSTGDGITPDQAVRWVQALADTPMLVDLGRDPTDLAGFVASGAPVHLGTIDTTPVLEERPVTLPGGEPYTGDGEDGAPADPPVAAVLTTDLVLEPSGEQVPLAFYLGPGGQGDDAVHLAPPAGTRLLVLGGTGSSMLPGIDDERALSPNLGYWTVVETSDGGFVIGGRGIEDRTSVDGITGFDELVDHLRT